MRIRLEVPDQLLAKLDTYAADRFVTRQTAIAFLLGEALLATPGHASAGAVAARVASPVLPETPATHDVTAAVLDTPRDVAAALREALARLTAGGAVTRLAAQNVVDEAGVGGDCVGDAAALLRGAGWHYEGGDVWTKG